MIERSAILRSVIAGRPTITANTHATRTLGFRAKIGGKTDNLKVRGQALERAQGGRDETVPAHDNASTSPLLAQKRPERVKRGRSTLSPEPSAEVTAWKTGISTPRRTCEPGIWY